MMTFFKKRHFYSDREPQILSRSTCVVLQLVLMTGGYGLPVFLDSVSLSPVFSQEVEDSRVSHQIPASNTGHRVESDQQNDTTIENLIADLGDSHYIVRDEAESRLLKIGGPAIALLRRALTHGNTGEPDSEVRLRATRLLILIERQEHDRKIREFLNGDDNELDLPGWSDFSAITGSDKASRKLFVDMHQAQPKLLAAINTGNRPLEELYQQVAKRSLKTSASVNASQTVATMVSMLFVSTIKLPSDQGAGPDTIAVSDVDLKRLQSVMAQPQMVTLVNSGGSKTQIRRLISKWLNSLPPTETTSINVQLSVISAYKLNDRIEEVTSFACNVDLPTTTRVSAIAVFGRLATADDGNKIETLLGDETVLGNYLPRSTIASANVNSDRSKLMQVQIRDLALATAIRTSGQDVTDFGFDSNCFAGEKLVPNQAGFFSEADREAALASWSNQKKAN